MTVELAAHERLDDLVLDGMKLIQRDDQFCFSLDTVLLAHFGPVPHGPALDLGTGTAAIPLILSARGAKDVTAINIIAAPEGIKYVEEHIDPSIDFKVVVCAVDERLNDKCYIVPGLGDAGDRLYGVID